MSFLTDTLAKAALKRMSGKAHTSNSKDLANESEDSFFTITAGDVFADAIPSDLSSAIAAGIATTMVSLELTLDPSSNGKAYFASIASVATSPLLGKINPLTGLQYVDNDRVGYLIPPQYGSDYRAILKDGGTEIPPSASEDWLFDYVSGIVTSEDNLELVSGTIEASVYIGRFLSDFVSTHDGYGVFTKGPGGVDGYSTVSGNIGIGTSTPSDKLTISLAASGGLAINNSSTNDPTIKLKLLNTDVFTAGVDNSDNDAFKIERGSTLGTYNDFVINQTDGYVGLGRTPVAKLSVYSPSQSVSQSIFTQNVVPAGLLMTSDYLNNVFTPGIFWSTSNNSNTKPKAGIYLKLTSSGSLMYLGTSNDYAVGITNDAIIINEEGSVGIGVSPTTAKLEIDNSSLSQDIFVVKENGTDVFVLPDDMEPPSLNDSLLLGNTAGFVSWATPQSQYINSRFSNFIHFEDFVISDGYVTSVIDNGTVIASNYVAQSAATGQVSAVVDGVDNANHPGIISLSCTSASTGDYATIMFGAASPFSVGTGQDIDVTAYIKINDLNASNTYSISFGLTDTSSGDPDVFASGLAHVILFYDSGSANWQSVVNGSYNTSGIAVTTGWKKLQIRFTGGATSVDFIVNGVTYSRTSITLPTGTDSLRPVISVKKILLNATTFTIGVDCIGTSIAGIVR